ncbi:MAG TPA: glycosyl hydrolase, partial [Polyangiaceae bacterium]
MLRNRTGFLVAMGIPALLALGAEACSGSSSDAGTSDAGTVGSSPGAGADGSSSSPSPGSSDAGAPPNAQDGAAPSAPPSQATFLTLDTSQYLSAGDGGVLNAAATSAGPTDTFTLVDLNAGALTDGDPIHLATSSGVYLTAADDDAGALAFNAATAGDDQTFTVVRIDGPGAIAAGDHVALQAKVTGHYVSAINGGGGQVLANAPWDKSWETFTLGLNGVASSDGGAAASDGGGAAESARQKVLAFLAGVTGKNTAIGIEDKDSTNPHADSDTMASMAGDGQNPSFWSADWGFGSGTVAARPTIVQEGIRQWGLGAIVQFIYHACPLTMDENCQWSDVLNSSLTDAQWTDLMTPGGTLNKAWLARLDTIAPFFQQLKAAGVAPLFRPLHEINGSWAWWQGRPGPDGSLKLYQMTHDYLVNTKGLDNIIWVWNVQDYATLADDVTKYSPGGSYFDIAALDVYNTGYTDGNYAAMQQAAGGKIIGVAECQNLPSTAVLAAQPLWAYVAM